MKAFYCTAESSMNAKEQAIYAEYIHFATDTTATESKIHKM